MNPIDVLCNGNKIKLKLAGPCHYLLFINAQMNDERIITRMKEGEVFELGGKTFTKWAGLLVAPDMESCELIKANVSVEFFNKCVVRIMYASRSMKK